MKKMLLPMIVAAGVATFAASPAVADSDIKASQNCKTLRWSKDKIHSLRARMNHYTHIILPEKMLKGTEPIVGNNELWDANGAGQHIYIKPNSYEEAGASTTVSVVTESGKAYDFLAERHTHDIERCVRIADGLVFGEEHAKALDTFVPPQMAMQNAQTEYLQRQLAQLQESAEQEKKNAVMEAIRKYRFHIYTRYEWSTGSGGKFMGKDLVSDIYDDGRFTYIRLRNDNKGLLTIQAELDGKEEIIQSKYDDLAKLYKIVGIYPKFIMRYGEAKVSISRADNVTQGAF